jgi:type IV secretion system protein TrbJ
MTNYSLIHMKRRQIKLLIVAAGVAALAVEASAQGIPVYDNMSMVNALTQIENQVENLAVQQAMQAGQQQMYQMQSKVLGGSQLGAAAPIIQQQMGVLNNAGMSVISGSVSATRDKIKSVYDSQTSNTAEGQAAASRATMDTIQASSIHAAQQQNDLAADAARIDALKAQSASATGQVEVMQAANEINLQLLQQQQKMQARQLVQDQANNAIAAQALADKTAADASTRKFLGIK